MDASPHPDDFERSDADPRLIGLLAAGIALFLAASPLLLRVVYPSAVQVAGIEQDLPRPVPPVLDERPKATLAVQHRRDDALLEGYGWIDRDQQVARIPISRAMQLLSERGLPGWPSAAAQSSR
jgi:hypothetical protein